MGQFNYKKDKASGATPSEWLRVSAAVGRVCNTWSGRTDIAATVTPDAGNGNPACYVPGTSEVEVNVSTCFTPGVDPSEIEKIDERDTQFEWPRATGAIFHEAMHARFSAWDLHQASSALTPLEFTALVQLEEGRIERLGLQLFPSNAGFLRTMALNIVIADIENVLSESDTMTAGGIAALALARVDAGSLDPSDVESLKTLVEKKISSARLEQLREIWRTAQMHTNHFDVSALYPLAKRWVEILNEAAEENGEERGGEDGSGSSGGSSSSGESGDSAGVTSGYAQDITDALHEAAESAEIAAYGDLVDTQTQEEWEEMRRSKAQDQKVSNESARVSDEVFGKGTGVFDDMSTYSRLKEERAPKASERQAAVQIANLLEKAKYRDRSETEVTSVVPPGRLRTRAAVQGAALKSKGVMTQTEPWRRTVRKHTDDPTLNIGVMVDISGSMGNAMESMATTAWVLSEAIRRVQGRAAMVYYGQDVFPTLKPGQHLDRVSVYSAPDMTEKFDKAFKALNGGLTLLRGSGARMLVIYSDGEYTSDETKAARRWIEACQTDGVAVLWIGHNSSRNFGARSIIRGTKAQFVEVPSDPTVVATAIGQAAAKALEAIH